MCEFASWCEIGFEAQAAWTQAILSVLAIAAAAGFPYWMASRDRARRVTALMELIGSMSDRTDASCDALIASVGGQSYRGLHDATDPGEYLKALDAIALDNLPDPKLMLVIVGLREQLRELQEVRRVAFAYVSGIWAVTDEEGNKARSIKAEIGRLYEATVQIDREHSPLTLKQKRKMRRAGITPDARPPDEPA